MTISGFLRVVGERKENGRYFCDCFCDPELGGCGKFKTVKKESILSKNTRSCGCLRLKQSLQSLEFRLWSKVEIENLKDPDSCWIWTGDKTKSNYGVIIVNKKRQITTRVIWKLVYNEELTGSLFVCHKCDNPLCVRPDHLFLGTQTDNMRDMVRKCRSKGHKNTNVKVTLAGAVDIIRRYKLGESQHSIARDLNICPSYVSRIVNKNIRFRHSS